MPEGLFITIKYLSSYTMFNLKLYGLIDVFLTSGISRHTLSLKNIFFDGLVIVLLLIFNFFFFLERINFLILVLLSSLSEFDKNWSTL